MYQWLQVLARTYMPTSTVDPVMLVDVVADSGAVTTMVLSLNVLGKFFVWNVYFLYSTNSMVISCRQNLKQKLPLSQV